MQNGETITVDENYIRESILEPQAKIVEGYQPVMPPYAGTLDDRQIDAIIEYLKTVN
jgi:cytochrome c oxidase subunit 2